jgi:hypothetical protein
MNLLKPVKYDKHGALFSARNLDLLLGFELKSGMEDTIIKRDVKLMTKSNEEIIKELETSIDTLSVLFTKLSVTTTAFVDETKIKVSKIKDVQGQLAQSIANVNKTISEPQLEKLVNNAEKLASALQSLDNLNKNGGLEKILGALK